MNVHLRELAAAQADIGPHLPYGRTRSDPEGHALELLHDAGVELPRVNVKITRKPARGAPNGLKSSR